MGEIQVQTDEKVASPQLASGGQKSFISSMLSILGGQAACAAIALVTEICYARLLGPAGRGQISLCLMAIAFGVLLGGVGGEGTIILWRADSKRKTSVWLPAVLLWGSLGCLIACVLWTVSYWRWHPPFLRGLSSSLALIILLSIPVGVALDYLFAMFVGQERFQMRARIATATQTAGLVALVLFLLFGRTSVNAMWANFASMLIGTLIGAFLLKDSFRGFWRIAAARGSFLPTLSFGLRGYFGLMASFFNYRLDVFVVNAFLNSAQVGLYALAVVISEALWQIPAAAALALYPRTARTVEDGATEFTCLIMRQILVIASVGAMAIGIGSMLFLPIIFGQRFRSSIAVIWLLLPGTLALSLGRIGVSDLAGRGKNGYSSVFSIISLAVTIVLDLTLIPRMGIQGAALASTAAYLTNTVLILNALKYELKVKWRALLVPTRSEWTFGQRAWLHLREWLKGDTTRTVAVNHVYRDPTAQE
jgi:O-antigen/teichoic acid export membrane protein